MRFFKSKPVSPETVSTDQIIPFHFWDDLDHTRSLCLDCTFRFDDVLDAEKVRAALARLLEIGDWRKLGARIRRNATTGKLEYHVPTEYTEKRPGFTYTHIKHDINIHDHPLASELPKMTDHPSLFGSPAIFGPLVRSPDAPRILNGWLYSDRPQLAIHVVSFKDATLLTVTFMHTLTDAMGLSSIFKAWTAVLHGREDEVPPFIGFENDPLAKLSEGTPGEQHILYPKILKGVSMLIFAIRYMFELVWYRQDERRVIFLPKQFLQQLRDNALQELATTSTDDPGKKPFVSEGDVVLSWWTRTMLSALNPAKDRTIAIMNVFDIRNTVSEDAVPPKSALLENAVFPTFTFLSARQILEEPLSFVASKLRSTIEQQRNRQQVEALAALQVSYLKKTGHPPMFGDSGLFLNVCSNWRKGKFFEMDFSPAVVNASATSLPLQQRANKLGQASYINVMGHNNAYSTRNAGVIIGKDAAGNWWMSWTLRTKAWPKIETLLAAIS